jgi:hypothetical protein
MECRLCWGEGHTRWRERGWESPNSDEGTYTGVLFIYTYFVVQRFGAITMRPGAAIITTKIKFLQKVKMGHFQHS